jgi:acyl carrier protein
MDDMKRVILDYVVREYVIEGSDVVIEEDTPLISGGIVDSLSMVSLKRFLEHRYEIRLPDSEATPEAFDTVNAIAALVARFRKV